MINWLRLFGLTLADYFTGTCYSVDLEVDVARKRQLLDVVIIRGEGPLPPEPCDGLDGLRKYNLLTYKSGGESLTSWSIEELIGHYVNYRKAFAMDARPEDCGLYAVSTRRPRDLLSNADAQEHQPGIFGLRILNREITLILPREVEPEPRNALWELFSFEAARVILGAQNYHWRQPDRVSILNEIYHHYQSTGIAMPYTFEDFRRDVAREVLPELSPEERLRGLPPEERLRGLAPEERLRDLDEVGLARLRELLDKRQGPIDPDDDNSH